MELILPLLIGFVLDAFIGDPYRLPHPIRTFGNAIIFFEKRFNKGENRKLKGALVAFSLIISTGIFFFLLVRVSKINFYIYYPFASILVFYGLANRSLINEAMKVNRKLEQEGLEAGRKQLSFIVGRDTVQLNPQQIRTAVLETLSENLSDGVIAPLFYYLIGGLPAMFAYKMINTLDSMIGYKNDRYLQFGFMAAKIDDVANYIPARITAFLMALVCFSSRGFRFVFRFGNKHSSPNAGYPEAALAGILDCRFGGRNVYHGKLVEKPFIGNNPRDVSVNDILKACRINMISSVVFVILSAVFLYFSIR